MRLDPWVFSLFVSLVALISGKVIDIFISRKKARDAAVAASKGPKVPTSWEEAYEDLTEKYLKLESEVADLKDQLAARDQAIRRRPYEEASSIFSDVEEIYKRLKQRRS